MLVELAYEGRPDVSVTGWKRKVRLALRDATTAAWASRRAATARHPRRAARRSSPAACTAVDLGPGQGWLSESDELVSIQVSAGVTTSDGVGAGTSRAEVLENYMAEWKDVMLVRASPTTDYEIATARGQVTQITLRTVEDVCPR